MGKKRKFEVMRKRTMGIAAVSLLMMNVLFSTTAYAVPGDDVVPGVDGVSGDDEVPARQQTEEKKELSEEQKQENLSNQWYERAVSQGAVISLSNGKAILGVEMDETDSFIIKITQAGQKKLESAGIPILNKNDKLPLKLTSVIIRAEDDRLIKTDPANRPVGSTYDALDIVGICVNNGSQIDVTIDKEKGDININDSNKMTVSAPLNVRSGPGTGYSKKGRLSKGDEVTVIEIKNSWAKILYNGETAYVSVKYLI